MNLLSKYHFPCNIDRQSRVSNFNVTVEFWTFGDCISPTWYFNCLSALRLAWYLKNLFHVAIYHETSLFSKWVCLIFPDCGTSVSINRLSWKRLSRVTSTGCSPPLIVTSYKFWPVHVLQKTHALQYKHSPNPVTWQNPKKVKVKSNCRFAANTTPIVHWIRLVMQLDSLWS